MPAEIVGSPETDRPFEDFLLSHPVILRAHPGSTDVYFDRDETAFRYLRTAPAGTLVGSWRSGMPRVLATLRERGFPGLHIASSASPADLQAALAIYRLQFGEDAPFDEIHSTRDFTWDGAGNKFEAFPAIAERSAKRGRHAIFIDDSQLFFDGSEAFDFINLPRELQYRDESATFSVPYTPPPSQ